LKFGSRGVACFLKSKSGDHVIEVLSSQVASMEFVESKWGDLTQGFIPKEAESEFLVCVVGYGSVNFDLFLPR